MKRVLLMMSLLLMTVCVYSQTRDKTSQHSLRKQQSNMTFNISPKTIIGTTPSGAKVKWDVSVQKALSITLGNVRVEPDEKIIRVKTQDESGEWQKKEDILRNPQTRRVFVFNTEMGYLCVDVSPDFCKIEVMKHGEVIETYNLDE